MKKKRWPIQIWWLDSWYIMNFFSLPYVPGTEPCRCVYTGKQQQIHKHHHSRCRCSHTLLWHTACRASAWLRPESVLCPWTWCRHAAGHALSLHMDTYNQKGTQAQNNPLEAPTATTEHTHTHRHVHKHGITPTLSISLLKTKTNNTGRLLILKWKK